LFSFNEAPHLGSFFCGKVDARILIRLIDGMKRMGFTIFELRCCIVKLLYTRLLVKNGNSGCKKCIFNR
jgi:hypothetical protein